MASDQFVEKPSVRLVAEAEHPQSSSGRDTPGFFKSAQWSADGTTVFTSSSTNTINSYILPEDLLTSPEPLSLQPQGTLILPEPASALAPCPYFTLQNPYSHIILAGAKDHPIQLHQAFSQPDPPSPSSPAFSSPTLASYPLIHAPTEAYQTPTALLWPSPGTHFIAGTRNLLAYFDASRSGSGSEPVLRIPTIPSARTNAKGGGVGMRGTVACLSVPAGWDGSGMSLVAAGTWTRWVGLYDLLRAGACAATWSVRDADAELDGYGRRAVGGSGILQTAWSPCGRYLVVNERRASGLLVYDVRGTGRLLAVLCGREGDTNQRLSCDVYPAAEGKSGFEVWAGSKDGSVLVWEGVGTREGYIEPSWDWQGHESAVGSTAMHSCGSVVATCSGEWTLVDQPESEGEDSDSDSDSDSDGAVSSSRRPRIKVGESSLKIWSIKAPNLPEDDSPAQAERSTAPDLS